MSEVNLKLIRCAYKLIILAMAFILQKANAVMGTYLPENSSPKSACMVIYTDNQENIIGLCSGDIVGTKKFLTAGHCQLDNPHKTLVVCGSEKQKTYHLVNKILIHPRYNLKNGHQYDHALLQVETPFLSSAVSLASSEAEVTSLINQNSCEVWGYGLDNLHKAGKLKGIKAEFSDIVFGKGLIGIGGKGWPTQGDSGGGLYCKNKDNQLIRVGTINRAEVGISSIASISGAIDWINEDLKQKLTDDKNDDLSPSPKKVDMESKSDSNEDPQEDSDSNVYREPYSQCVTRLQIGASYDDSGWLKENLSEVINNQCGPAPDTTDRVSKSPKAGAK